MDPELPTIPATTFELADMDSGNARPHGLERADKTSCGNAPVQDKDSIHSGTKRKRILRAASSLAPDTSKAHHEIRSEAGVECLADKEGLLAANPPPTATQPARDRRKLLRAASSLAPSHSSQSTWRDPPSPTQVDDHVAVQVEEIHGKDSCCAGGNELSERVAVEPTTPTDLGHASGDGPALATNAAQFQDGSKPDPLHGTDCGADEMQCCDVGVGPAHTRYDVTRLEPHMADIACVAARPEVQPVQSEVHVPTRRRIVGKQSLYRVSPLSKASSVMIRETLGHVLRPPEAGFLVRVHGDGWGGPLEGGAVSYLATITEADAMTYTVVRRGDCHGSWDETHVLKKECCIIAKSASQQDIYLRDADVTSLR